MPLLYHLLGPDMNSSWRCYCGPQPAAQDEAAALWPTVFEANGDLCKRNKSWLRLLKNTHLKHKSKKYVCLKKAGKQQTFEKTYAEKNCNSRAFLGAIGGKGPPGATE